MRTKRCLPWQVLYVVAVLGALPALAQPPCEPADTTHFTTLDQGGYNYQFEADPPSGWTVLTYVWAFAGPGFSEFSVYPTASVQFPGQGVYLACLRTTQEQIQGYPCISMDCELITVAVDSACAGLNAGFSIDPQAGAIQFNDLTTGLSPGNNTLSWDFGDGTTSVEAAPQHTYAGAGPYQACLTVNSGGCTTTACNWIYLGPAEVPCETLLQPAIGVIQYERTIAVFDQSITSGMSSDISWDLGDGTAATGSPVIHTYLYDGDYQVCGTIDLWGPLTTDTCAGMACEFVHTYALTSIGVSATMTPPHVFPLPFTDHFTVESAWTGPGAHWYLYDPMGKVLSNGAVPAVGTFVVEGEDLVPGVYLLRMVSPTGTSLVRVVKGGE